MSKYTMRAFAVRVPIVITAIATVAPAQGQHTARISESTAGIEANGDSWAGYDHGRCISGDGRLVVFSSLATNLVPNTDNSDGWDVFVRNRDVSGNGVFDEPGDVETSLVSVSTTGTAADRPSGGPAISANGRYVIFQSAATDLVPGIGHWEGLGFVRDLAEGTTRLITVNRDGEPFNRGATPVGISDDGRFVVINSAATNVDSLHPKTTPYVDAFLHDRDTHGWGPDRYDEPGNIDTIRISGRWCNGQFTAEANNTTYAYEISGDGRHVAYWSEASNLLCANCPEPLADCNGASDDFVFDRLTNRLTRVTVSTAGVEGSYSFGPSISGDGRYVIFGNHANLMDAPAVRDDRNPDWLYLRDRDVQGLGSDHYDEPGNVQTTVLSTDSAGVPGPGQTGSISRNGRFVVFPSPGEFVLPNQHYFWEVYLRDRDYDGNGIYDEPAGVAVVRVALAQDCAEANERTQGPPCVSDDGRHVVFDSMARNLLGPPDGAARRGIYVRDRGTCKGSAVTMLPVSQSSLVCDPVALTIRAIGDPPLMYQWRRYGTPGDPNTATPLSDEPGHIAGAQSDTLTLWPTDPNDSGMYDCVVANNCLCSETWSAPATLVVQWRVGDMNCDGSVTFKDIDPFVRALGGPDYYYAIYPDCWWPNGDCDSDGYVTFRDIDCFVAQLGTGCQ